MTVSVCLSIDPVKNVPLFYTIPLHHLITIIMRKSLFIFALVAMMFSLTTYAQNAKKKVKKAEKVERVYIEGQAKTTTMGKYKQASVASLAQENTAKLARKLNLTTAQQQQVLQINTASVQKIQSLQSNSNLDASALKSLVKQEYASRNAAISSVLDINQTRKYKAMRDHIKAKKMQAVK